MVDDFAVERLALQEVLGRNGYQVLIAESGEQAIARSRSDRPDPDPDGRGDARHERLPGHAHDLAPRRDARHPIIITGEGQETDKIWGMRQGALDYLVKPVNHDELLARIRAMG